MRKMFSENQIKGLAVQSVNDGINNGEIQRGYDIDLYMNQNEIVDPDDVTANTLPNAAIESPTEAITALVASNLYNFIKRGYIIYGGYLLVLQWANKSTDFIEAIFGGASLSYGTQYTISVALDNSGIDVELAEV